MVAWKYVELDRAINKQITNQEIYNYVQQNVQTYNYVQEIKEEQSTNGFRFSYSNMLSNRETW